MPNFEKKKTTTWFARSFQFQFQYKNLKQINYFRKNIAYRWIASIYFIIWMDFCFRQFYIDISQWITYHVDIKIKFKKTKKKLQNKTKLDHIFQINIVYKCIKSVYMNQLFQCFFSLSHSFCLFLIRCWQSTKHHTSI